METFKCAWTCASWYAINSFNMPFRYVLDPIGCNKFAFIVFLKEASNSTCGLREEIWTHLLTFFHYEFVNSLNTIKLFWLLPIYRNIIECGVMLFNLKLALCVSKNVELLLSTNLSSIKWRLHHTCIENLINTSHYSKPPIFGVLQKWHMSIKS